MVQREILTTADLLFKDKKIRELPLSKLEVLDFLINNKKYSKIPDIEIFNRQYNDYLEIFNLIIEKNLKPRYFNSLNKIFSFWHVNNTSINYYLCRGYSYDESVYLLKSRQSTMTTLTAAKIQETIKNKSNEEILEINQKKGNCNRYEFYLDKINQETGKLYTEDEAKLKIKNKQSKAFINRWKKIKNGEIQYFPNTTLQYYLNKGLSFDEANTALIDRQKTFSLELCIEKYGEEKGKKRFEERQKKWKIALDSKTDEEKERIKRSQFSRLQKYSSASFLFFNSVTEFLNLEYDLYFGKNEYLIYDKKLKRCFFFDFVIPELKLCIEYNGLTFHPHPDLNEDQKNKWIEPFSKMNYYEKLDFDIYKNDLIQNKGFELLIIWENDIHKKQKAINFIKYKKEKYERKTN